ncbi:ATP-dependent protease ATPase subunit HslU [Thermomicrobium sp. 4228-Ro]|uniref:ATP-dependent protease ATPase subunit HslU n=1 Tax=Thermomicrobium sp. 4228-Ro TaxID=2993937 RepID=UPI0022490946|nr:ATP-dependent protease ATPase subunit HslU [Thermomicrobium sp. 4228-Ro]MCX2727126.1 ATP-dependent protease ATPase subunit HslU [Thermomicrobium sp. 4228-Ro]
MMNTLMTPNVRPERGTIPLTPAEIVAELDRYIVGQQEAKRAVAIAIRNRWRWQQLPEELRRDIVPKNILMIGPTGVGKTEIARRVAKLVDAPFVKVEATKFTEVGYVGRDVESIIRELVEVSISMLHGERLEAVREEASRAALQRLADLLVEQRERRRAKRHGQEGEKEEAEPPEERRKRERRMARERRRLLELLSRDGMEDETIELDLETEFDLFVTPYAENGGLDLEEFEETVADLLESLQTRRRTRRVSIREARRILTQQEAQRLVDFDAVVEAAVKRAEESGIVFIDEIDKLITKDGEYGPDVSGEGVQRDLLPIVEGSVVMTRYGPVRTDHILFIAAGAFHNASPSDLIPELQGRFPIRVELHRLTEDDLYRILTVPENALTRQYRELLRVEGVELDFTEDGLREIARLAALVNSRAEDIGARRLATIMEKVIEEISFRAPEFAGQTVRIGPDYVRQRVGEIVADEDLSKFIL